MKHNNIKFLHKKLEIKNRNCSTETNKNIQEQFACITECVRETLARVVQFSYKNMRKEKNSM